MEHVCPAATAAGAPLRRLPAGEAAAAVERPVGLGVQAIALEDDEPRVHASPTQRLHVRPRDARGVHGAVDDAQGPLRYASHSSWSK